MSQTQLKLFRGSEEIPVSNLGMKQKRSGVGRSYNKTRKDLKQKTSEKGRNTCTRCCTRCGKNANHTKCPAVETICKYCKKSDQWLSVCRKRDRAAVRMNTMEQEGLSDEDTIIDIPLSTTNKPNTNTFKSDKWLTTRYVCDTPLKFRIDTGAKCNVIVKSQYMKAGIHGNEQDSQTILRTFTNHTTRLEFLLIYHSLEKWVILPNSK